MDSEKVFIGVDISQDSLDMVAYPTGQVWQYKNSKGGITKAIAKHNYGPGSPAPVISFLDAFGGYFASRILGSQVLERGGILEKYMEAINKAHSEGVVYTFPEDSDQGDDPDAWPLQSNLSELEDNSEDGHY